MSEALWHDVDRYLVDRLVNPDAMLDAAREASCAAGQPDISVAPNQGKLLQLLVRIHKARRVLEIGTLGGYSTIWLARALPADGYLLSLEFSLHHAEVAQTNLLRAGLADRVEVRVGVALELLPKIAAAAPPPFDFVFIDADKASIPEYFEWALKLTQVGSLIVVDNVVRHGKLVDAEQQGEDILGVRRFIDSLRDGRARQCNGDPDRRQQGLRRLCTGARAVATSSKPREAAGVSATGPITTGGDFVFRRKRSVRRQSAYRAAAADSAD